MAKTKEYKVYVPVKNGRRRVKMIKLRKPRDKIDITSTSQNSVERAKGMLADSRKDLAAAGVSQSAQTIKPVKIRAPSQKPKKKPSPKTKSTPKPKKSSKAKVKRQKSSPKRGKKKTTASKKSIWNYTKK